MIFCAIMEQNDFFTLRERGFCKMKTVCFTGHRQIPFDQKDDLIKALELEIEKQIVQGAEVFRTGGALGFDTLAALAVLKAKKKHPDIRLELILPCPTQTLNWTSDDVRRYEKIQKKADGYRYVSNFYYDGVLQARNNQLVDGADVCIAYLQSSHGGSAYTSARAIRKGLDFVNLAEEFF